ncbi:nucleotide exchange factor GrpE [candidate division WOR-1 bacterium RIFCSPLOWO2_02_FULL_46_20]|uniref:Protein GrpE n=2 Tax=Saganbacteria TaxID=1703751 RepID=A0A1F4RD77_UNCSA|nr:MAG: nucleotide exchange factor GrpE [candidate division WOR-1 bacterium RIFCSPHIGHO2_02_FULL_45_12]OGC05423.1 MAG: nucleotide exchange factor GrpE [candidate division WOR-1 bacterium RIFCSPLOWO2_02_FULL_46_20]OGC08992.1 MAG: nucleotide exchange factor GrpE [candidate division WOR-1 bacterium RIFCSPLOWO2_12_FULL_45_9]
MTKKKEQDTSRQTSEAEGLKEQLAEQKNRLLRALADFDNYKKRSNQDKEQFAQFANAGLIIELLPILDGFGRAIDAAAKGQSGEEMIKGLSLVKKQFIDALKKHGVVEIEALNMPYDAHAHEAILQKEHDGPEGIIIEEMQKGYLLNGRVIRPSMVIVSKKGEE